MNVTRTMAWMLSSQLVAPLTIVGALALADDAVKSPTRPQNAVKSPAGPQAGRSLAPISARYAHDGCKEVPSFQRHVVPLLGKLGCNGRACHGSFQGRGGFRLSLFGYDFKMDHDALFGGDEPRVNLKEPEKSLIIQKPTEQIPHEGGLRYKLGTWEHRVLLGWIRSGAAGAKPSDPHLVRLETQPAEIAFAKKGDRVALRVVAHWSDGSSEDVTPLCRFQSNDEQIGKVDATGVVTSVDPGDSHVVVFYDSGVVPVPMIRPVSDTAGPRYPDVPAPTEIDRLVVKKLRKLGIIPSEVCADAEFLRRVSLDLTGTLPTADEAAAFLADHSADKRRRKVDELLSRPAYAAWWTTRLCDITGNNERAVVNITPINQSASQEWYDWILQRVRDNVPYDRLVEGIVLATSRRPDQSYFDYSAEMTAMYRPDAARHYADRPGLTHYWARRTVQQPQQKALSFAYSFLGIRIQCAECHKHPFDQWTQSDYKDFTKFFARVRYGVEPSDGPQHAAILASIDAGKKRGNDLRREFPRLLREGKVLPFDEVYVDSPRRRAPARARRPRPLDEAPAKNAPKVAGAKRAAKNKPVPAAPRAKGQPEFAARQRQAAKQQAQARLQTQAKAKLQANARKQANAVQQQFQARLLGAETVDLSRVDDPRVPLMQWLRSAKNRYFARAFVNRVWAAYFNVGIVNPPDDLSLANPPSNAELLDYLADGFVKHGYDMKWLHREILNSRTYQLSWRPNDTNRLDQRNFSHAIVRRLPAEVAYDAVRQATSADAVASLMRTDCRTRAIGVPGSARLGRGGSAYALSVFGRSIRESNCDCDRSNEPSLLQTVFLRNDSEVLAMVYDPKDSWVAQIARELGPKRPAAPRKAEAKPKPAAAPAKRKPAVAAKPNSATSLRTAKLDAARTAKEPRKANLLTPEQKQRQVARLAEQLKQAKEAGRNEQVKRLAGRLEELKRRPTSPAAQRPRVVNLAPPAVIKPSAVSAEKKAQLVRSAYLRSLSRYPQEREESVALAHLNESDNLLAGLRDLVWALVNTQEFIVNH